jgi:hypothetical protein
MEMLLDFVIMKEKLLVIYYTLVFPHMRYVLVPSTGCTYSVTGTTTLAPAVLILKSDIGIADPHVSTERRFTRMITCACVSL